MLFIRREGEIEVLERLLFFFEDLGVLFRVGGVGIDRVKYVGMFGVLGLGVDFGVFFFLVWGCGCGCCGGG